MRAVDGRYGRGGVKQFCWWPEKVLQYTWLYYVKDAVRSILLVIGKHEHKTSSSANTTCKHDDYNDNYDNENYNDKFKTGADQ